MNKVIFKSALKANWLLTGILIMVGVVVIGLMFVLIGGDAPQLMGTEVADGVIVYLPQDNNAHPAIVLDMAFFTSIGIETMMLLLVITSNKLITKEIERGHMSYWLGSSLSRNKIMRTKMVFFILQIFMYALYVWIVGAILIGSMGFSGYTIGSWTLSVLGFFVLSLALGGIAFFFASYFNKSGYAIAASGGVLIFFWITNMLGTMGFESLEMFKYLSINTLFNPSAFAGTYEINDSTWLATNAFTEAWANAHGIDSSTYAALIEKNPMLATYVVTDQNVPFEFTTTYKASTWIPQDLVLAIIAGGFFTAGIITFRKKDLPL